MIKRRKLEKYVSKSGFMPKLTVLGIGTREYLSKEPRLLLRNLR